MCHKTVIEPNNRVNIYVIWFEIIHNIKRLFQLYFSDYQKNEKNKL